MDLSLKVMSVPGNVEQTGRVAHGELYGHHPAVPRHGNWILCEFDAK